MTDREQIQIECRAPRNGEFFRVNPDPAQRGEHVLTRDPIDGTLYLVAPNMVPEMEKLAPERLERCIIFIAQNQAGETFLWPVPLPVPIDHPAYQAMDEWIAIQGLN